MVNLKTTYMGLELSSPLVVSANPLSESLDNIKRMEDAGAGAIVLFSLFAEQIRRERELMMYYTSHGADSFAEALTFFPEPPNYHAGPDQYLELIRKAREATAIPIVASLNGTSPDRWSKLAQLVDQLEGWTTFARRMEQAGASAIELNIYYIPTDPGLTG